MTGSLHFPFSAIVGQEDMKEALLCNAVHPGVGGVLISGTRGTAKSTAARSLAHLLPPVRAVADCPYNCPPDDPERQCERCAGRDFGDRPELVEEVRTPFVDLPIGATEDRVLGTIDLESAIREGERSFEPGLLARANRGILYVDEVNLLADHLVDVLLDAVATGTNRVEREGVSVEHPANVMLVGTMNPEEGELRPQLLDRFGLYVEMDRGMAPEDRKAVVRRRTRYDDDPEGMLAEWREEEAALASRIEEARAALPEVRLGDELVDRIVHRCVEHDVDGLRADVVIHRTARAIAALDGEREVGASHVDRAAELALGHRSRSNPSSDRGRSDPSDGSNRRPPENPPEGTAPEADRPASAPTAERPNGGEAEEEVDTTTDEGEQRGADEDEGSDPGGEGPSAADDDGSGGDARGHDGDDDGAHAGGRAIEDRVFPMSAGRQPPLPEPARRIELPDPAGSGGRSWAVTDGRRGAYYRARRPEGRATDVALDATLRAAAPHQAGRRARNASGLAVQLRPSDLREKRRRSRVRNLVVFVVDSSGSMGAYERMSAVKGSLLSLLEDAYQQRDYVSLVGFRGDGAETLLPPTSSVRRAARELAEMPTGGRTPLAAGLDTGLRLVEGERRKHTELVPLLVLVTDGRPNHAEPDSDPVREAIERARQVRERGVPAVCFDTETGPVRMRIVRRLAREMGAEYYRFDDLDPGRLSATVSDVLGGERPDR